jgi:hypothetical protein
MHVKHWLIGCALCFVGIGSAAASNRDTQDLDNSTRAVTDSTTSHEDAGTAGGDVVGLTRNCPQRSATHDSSGSNPGSSSDRSGGSGSSPAPAKRSHLGWQSLLPGSIQ